MRIILHRMVQMRQRYYTMETIANLFGEYLLICTYGSSKRAKPTGVRLEMFMNVQDANKAFDDRLMKKIKKGYLSR